LWHMDEANLATIFRRALEHIYPRAMNLLSLERLTDFVERKEEYENCIREVIQKKADEAEIELHPYLLEKHPAWLFDGLRQPLSRCGNGAFQLATWSENNLLYGGIVDPSGFVAALTRAEPGSQNDHALVTDEFIEKLAECQMSVLCDSIFTEKPWMVPIPNLYARNRLNFTQQDGASMSAARVPVEWSFGLLQSKFPYVFASDKNKLLSGSPEKSLFAYVMLLNVLICDEGTNSTTYFACEPKYTAVEYLQKYEPLEEAYN